MEITKARLKEIIIEELQESLNPARQAESDGRRDYNAETFGDDDHIDKGDYWENFEGGKYIDDYELGYKNAMIDHDLTLEEKQLDEISPRTQYSRGGVSGIYDNAVDLMKMLEKHTESFDDPPEILDNMKTRLDLILGAAKQATAEYVAGSALDRKERARMRSRNLAFRGNGEKYSDGEFPEDMFGKYKE